MSSIRTNHQQPSPILRKQNTKQNEQFVDYLQNQNLYNPEYDNQQYRNERKSILKPTNQERNRSLSTNNRAHSESNTADKQETIPLMGRQQNNQSQSSLDQNQQNKIKSFLSPNYYKQNFKAIQVPQKKEEQIEDGLRNIELRRLERDKNLIENYFNIPLVLRTNKKILFEQEQNAIMNQSSSAQNDEDGPNPQQQYKKFKQNQETYKLNNSLNKQLEQQNSETKQEKQRFKLREQLYGSPYKQGQLTGSRMNNNNASILMSSISTSAGSKQLQNNGDNNNISKGRYSSINQNNHQRSRSVKQYSYHQSSSKKTYQQQVDYSNQSFQNGNSLYHPQDESFLDKSVLETDVNSNKKMNERKIQFERSFDKINHYSSNKKLHEDPNISPFLNASITSSIARYGYTEASNYTLNSPILTNQHDDSSVITIPQCYTPVAENKKGTNSNKRKFLSMMSNVIDGHSPDKLLFQQQQKIEYIPSIDQPPLILPIEENKPAEIYQEVYVNEIGQPFSEETPMQAQQNNKFNRSTNQYNQQTHFLKESFISSFDNKDSSFTAGVGRIGNEYKQNNNNSASNLNQSYQFGGESSSILKSNSFQLNKDNYDILKNYSIKNQMDKGTHSEIYKVKNLLTNKYQVAKRIQFTSKYAEQAFQNEEQVLSYFFDEGGSIKKQFQNHAGAFKLIQTTHIEKLQNEGIFIQQPGGKSLSHQLLEIREETLKGELISHIYPTKLHKSLQNHKEQFYELIASICEVIDLFSSNQLVHSDLRLENILVDTLDFGDSSAIQSIKISDFGSSYFISNRKGVSNITPEYMPPEILQQILGKQGHDVFLEEIPWSVDIWTLGCIMLEIIVGIPIWMPQRCLLHSHGCDPKKVTSGIFSHKERRIDRIFEKQVKFANQIDTFLKQYQNPNSPALFKIDQTISNIIQGIFKIDPKERISPQQIIKILRNV